MITIAKKFSAALKNKLSETQIKVKTILFENRGELNVQQAILIIAAVVIGGLMLGGLYTLFQNIILPNLSSNIQDMFNYNP